MSLRVLVSHSLAAGGVGGGPAVTGPEHIRLDLGLAHEDGRLARFAPVSPRPKEKLLDLLSASDGARNEPISGQE